MENVDLLLNNPSYATRLEIFRIADLLGVPVYSGTRESGNNSDFPHLLLPLGRNNVQIVGSCGEPAEGNKYKFVSLPAFIKALAEVGENKEIVFTLNDSYDARFKPTGKDVAVGCQVFEKKKILELAKLIEDES